jgi:hypothetical protein
MRVGGNRGGEREHENENGNEQCEGAWVGCAWRTLSTFAAGNEDVDKTRDSELTDVSPELAGSTAPNDWWYIAGTVASAITVII